MGRLLPLPLSLATLLSTGALVQAQQPEAQRTDTPSQALPAAATIATASGTAAALAPKASHMAAVSQVRIVRLSEIRGEAQLDRNSGQGYQRAFANIPITKGSRLNTTTGVAEVEFEDNSTLRLTPETTVEFVELGRAASGATITRCHVLRGTVYVNLAHTQGTEFAVSTGKTMLKIAPASHLRLSADTTEAHGSGSNVAVMAGSVDLTGPAGATTVTKKRTLGFSASDATPFTLANNVQKSDFDEWDKQEGDYQNRYQNTLTSSGAGGQFGASDLAYYGSFSDAGGCGSLWRPYFANAAWDPYSAGAWAMYPGAGYSWVSAYPWGWLPFHSGSWQNCGSGWGWRPGGQWQGLTNSTLIAGNGNGLLVHPPVKPPAGKAPMVVVNNGGVPASRSTAPGTFTFLGNSAGLGVPRDTFGKLAKTSTVVARDGSATAPVEVGYLGAPATARASGTGSGSSTAPHAVLVLARPSSGGATANSSAVGAGPTSTGTRAGSGRSSTSTTTQTTSYSSSVSQSSTGRSGGGGGSSSGGHK